MPQALAGAHLVALLRELAPPIASTPVAFVDLDRIADSIRLIRTSCARASVAYAVKASYLRPLLNAAREAGAGISVFSELELGLAREAGFAPHEIVYNGVGRHGAELGAAIEAGVRVNVESLGELRALLAARPRGAASAAVGLRVNGAGGPAADSPEKYGVLGMSFADVGRCLDLAEDAGLTINALSFHLFANQLNADRHLEFLDLLIPVIRKVSGHASARFEHVNVGGGFASRSEVGDARAAAAAGAIGERIEAELGLATVFELGRFVAADAEALVSRVVDVRATAAGQRVAILDATTNYLIPAPGHRFRAERLRPLDPGEACDEVRFVDRLGSDICRGSCGRLEPGSLVCVTNSGAYAGVMKERFVYPLPHIVFLGGGRVTAASPAGDIHDVMRHHDWHRIVQNTGARDR